MLKVGWYSPELLNFHPCRTVTSKKRTSKQILKVENEETGFLFFHFFFQTRKIFQLQTQSFKLYYWFVTQLNEQQINPTPRPPQGH